MPPHKTLRKGPSRKSGSLASKTAAPGKRQLRKSSAWAQGAKGKKVPERRRELESEKGPKPGELEAAPAPEVVAEEHANWRNRERSAYDGDTAIKLYLREIGQVKLLTPDEEVELAAR